MSLTNEQIESITRFRGKRFSVRTVISTLRLCDPKDPQYPDIYNAVARLVNRTTEISIRVTDHELTELKSLASRTGHRRMADYIRSAALNATITTPPPVQIIRGNNNTLDIKAAVRALQGIGKNINQLVLNLNVHRKHHVVDDATAAKYRAEIERLLSDLKKLEVPRG